MENEELRGRLADLYRFVLLHLPPAPASVLEVGCGRGELARAVARAGYSVTAIDPDAPEGTIFRRTELENFSHDGTFDAVVASVSLHHIADLTAAFDKIERLLRPGGILIMEEFAKEQFAGTTAQWYYHQRRALAAVDINQAPMADPFDEWFRRWEEEHADIHSLAELTSELDRRFGQRYVATGPYLYDYWLTDGLEALERELIDSGLIDATGFRYVGMRRG